MTSPIFYFLCHLCAHAQPPHCVVVQVKTLQLEREQSQILLEKVREQHKQDVELMENAHKWVILQTQYVHT